MDKFKTPEEFASWLEQKGLFHMDLGLGRMRACLGQMRAGSAPIVQILGTNGKGSTSVFLERLCREHGLKTGLYTSPHFISPKERILINGVEPDDQIWLEAANAVSRLDCSLTYFEFLTLMALHIFWQEQCEIIILEAGLGGANDATSAIDAQIHCFTPIAMDHAAIIGPGIEDIARDKLAAIKPGSYVFSANQFPAVAALLERECQNRDCALGFSARAELRGLLQGKIQEINAGLALAAWERLGQIAGIRKDATLAARALALAFIPGRRQVVEAGPGHGPLLLDGGHNPHALWNLLRENPQIGAIIFSALADKNWQASLAMLSRLNKPVFIPQLENSRAASAREMAAWGQKHASSPLQAMDNIEDALTESKKFAQPTLITGSLYLLAALYEKFPNLMQKEKR